MTLRINVSDTFCALLLILLASPLTLPRVAATVPSSSIQLPRASVMVGFMHQFDWPQDAQILTIISRCDCEGISG